MIGLIQICVVLSAIQWHVDSTPIFESINIERKVNIGFKPMKIRPITFIKEKWGPFGRFGKKHVIEKRGLNEINTIDSGGEIIKPVALIIEEPIKPVIEKIDDIDPPPYRLANNIITDNKEAPSVTKLNTDITSALAPFPANYFTPIKKPDNLDGLGPQPILETVPIEGPLFVPFSPPSPPPPLPTLLPPPPPPVVEEPPPRFGGLARFFGDILSEIFNRILTRARASIIANQTPPDQQ